MEKELNTRDYLGAAKMIATCPEKRLPFVLEIIKQSGIDLSMLEDEILKINSSERKRKYNRKTFCKRVTTLAETEDELVLRLQKAYNDKISFMAISKVSGVNRSTLYKYIWGDRKVPDDYRDQINYALDKIYEEGGF